MNRKVLSILVLGFFAACASSPKPVSGPTIDQSKTQPGSENRSADIDKEGPAPTDAEGFFARANRRYSESKFDGAIADYSEALKLNPAHASALQNRCVAKIGLKDFAGSIEDCTKAIQLNPQYGIAYNSRCWARLQLKQDLPAALADCNKAIELAPGYVNAYDSRGQLYMALNDKKQAVRDLEKALSMDASLKDTADALEKAKQMPDK